MSLPRELDFALDSKASPARMNLAMEYIVAKIRALEAVSPDFAAAVDQLKAVGLERLTEVLAPIFVEANNLADALAAIEQAWIDNDLPGQIQAEVTEVVTAAFSDYRSRYLGARATAPLVDDEGNAVVIGTTYFDTALDSMRVLSAGGWKGAGSVVESVMGRQSYTAAGGETSVTVPSGYDAGNIIVAVNGYMLSPSDVVVTSGTVIGFPAALSAGDEVSWVKFGVVTQSDQRRFSIAMASAL